MKILSLVFLALLGFGAAAADKTAYISTKELLEKSPQAVKANSALKEQFGDRERQLRDLATEIQEMEAKYQTDAAIMSAEQRKKAEDDIVQKRRRFQFDQQSLKEDLQARQRELLQEVQLTIRSVIQQYGAENGYDYIFTDTSIAYAADAMNITEDILERLEQMQ